MLTWINYSSNIKRLNHEVRTPLILRLERDLGFRLELTVANSINYRPESQSVLLL